MHENNAIKVTLIEPGMVDTPFFDNQPDRRPRGRRHRRRGHLRDLPARPGRRQRDPDPALLAADLGAVRSTFVAPRAPFVDFTVRPRMSAPAGVAQWQSTSFPSW